LMGRERGPSLGEKEQPRSKLELAILPLKATGHHYGVMAFGIAFLDQLIPCGRRLSITSSPESVLHGYDEKGCL
jgi:hypothetical protein